MGAWDLRGRHRHPVEGNGRLIRKIAREVLGVSKALGSRSQESQWWNGEVQRVVKAKRECYKKLPKAEDKEAFEEYKRAKREHEKSIMGERNI